MPSVVIPAHQEENSIVKAIKSLLGDEIDDLEIVVVANACSDRTARRAAAVSESVRVIETEISGKCHAMNLGDEAVTSFPRMYMDGDVSLLPGGFRRLLDSFEQGFHLICPRGRFDRSGLSTAARLVLDGQASNRFYNGNHAPNGSGIFMLSGTGRSRWGKFPEAIINDDGFVGLHFDLKESQVIREAVSVVYPPKTFRDLIGPRSRSIRGNWQLARLYPEMYQKRYEGIGRDNAWSILQSPNRWVPGVFYGTARILARARAMTELGGDDWHQDRSGKSRDLEEKI